jgi:hypothetical protein
MILKIFFNKSNFLSLLLIIALQEKSECIRLETKELISQWAPVIWIHPEDPFFPSNVDFYLQNMEVRQLIVVQGFPSINAIKQLKSLIVQALC